MCINSTYRVDKFQEELDNYERYKKMDGKFTISFSAKKKTSITKVGFINFCHYFSGL